MKNYFLFLALYAVIIVEINCSNEVRQHDVIDEDIRNVVGHIIQDSDINTHLLLQRNLSVNRIYFKDDLFVSFHDINITKLPYTDHTYSDHASLYTQCTINDVAKIQIPMGYYQVNGSFEKKSFNKIYPFSMYMIVYAGIDIGFNLFQDIEEKFEIHIDTPSVEIHSNDSSVDKNDTIDSIINSQLPSIKSQILNQLFQQIEKHELLSYYSTIKNYCFPTKIEPAKFYYLINQTYELTNSQLEPAYNKFIINWIKLENVTFALILGRNFYPETMIYNFFGPEPTNVTFSGYYAGNSTDSKKSSEYHIQLKYMNMNLRDESSQVTPHISRVSVAVVVYERNEDPSTRTWLLQYGEKIQKIIRDDWASFIQRKYDEV